MMRAELVVKGILFNRDFSKMLLLQRSSDDPTGPNTWEGVGGNMECGETPEDALKREISEEAGIAAFAIQGVAYVTLVNGAAPYLIIAYRCVAQTEAVTLSREHQAFLWANQDECRALLPQAIIDDFEQHGIWGLFRKKGG